MNFLHAVAENLYSRYGDKISSLTLVFPSRRSQLFFFDELCRLIDKPVWSPEYLSLDEVISSFTDLKKADDFSLLILLYEVYRKHTGSDEPFDGFFFWGETLLGDFNDIDKYLVDTGLLFRNLKAQKDIDGDFSFMSSEQIAYIRQFWNSFDPRRKSELQGKFIEIWDALPAVYNDFRRILAEKNQAYSGMIYRDAAEKIRNGACEQIDKHYVFAGFNSIGECEATLFSHLQKAGKADFYWDCDRYYIDDKAMEAGMFLRKNTVDYPSPPDFDLPSEFAGEKDIHIIAAPSDVIAAKAVPQILDEMNAGFDKKTAIVLANENILIPVLYSLPEQCADVNVTLGYPLVQTPVFTLAELLIRLQNSYKPENRGFYYKDVLAILRHGYVNPVDENGIRETVSDIILNNRIYVNKSIFEKNDFLSKIFTPLSGYSEIAEYLTDILDSISMLPDFGNGEKRLRYEYIHSVTVALNKLTKAIGESGTEIGKAVFLSLVRNIFRGLKIPFTGEPLKGLQVMSIHETKSLDFDNIILLSANEGQLPPNLNQLSYIPYNLRKGYGLPCFEHAEANAAYNFYRLVQRAKKVRLLYSSRSDETGSGEMSRYLYQIKFESGLKIKEYPITFNISFGEKKDIFAKKDEKTMQALMEYTGKNPRKSLSPSALNSYLNCQLKFYFEKIAKLKEDETVTEEIPLNLSGNIIHRVMEALYIPLKNKTVTVSDMESIIEDKTSVNTLIDRFFAREFYKTDSLPADFSENGQLLVVRDVIRKYVKGILQYDKKRKGFIPLDFEKKVGMRLDIGNLSVALSGVIDRIDRTDDKILIIDYKTGSGRGRDNRMAFNGTESLFDSNPDKRNKEAFQTFLYACMYRNENPQDETIPAIYFVRDCHSADFNHLLIDKSTDDENERTLNDFSLYEPEFLSHLQKCLQEIFDSSIPFKQTEYVKTCEYCPFNCICRKV